MRSQALCLSEDARWWSGSGFADASAAFIWDDRKLGGFTVHYRLMPLLKIAHYPEPVLLTVGKPLSEEDFNSDLERLVADMFETMYEAGGVGLAAPQIFE